jgi:hypothetical protein
LAPEGYTFNGNGSDIDFGPTPGNFGTNNFTIDFWLRTSVLNTQQALINKRNICNLGNMWDARTLASGGIVFEMAQNSSTNSDYINLQSFSTVNDSGYHEVTLYRTGPTVTMYIDSVFQNLVLASGVANITNTTDLIIGTDPCDGYSSVALNGFLGAIRFMPFSLTSDWSLADWWKGESNALDSAGPNNGTITGTVTYAPGHPGDAFEFNGSSSYVDFGPTAGNFGTSNFMIDFWIQTTNTAEQSVIGKRSTCGYDNMWDIRSVDSGVFMEICQDSSGTDYATVGTTPINDGQFHEITIKRNGLELSMYADGVLTDTVLTTGVVDLSNSTDLIMGKSACVGGGGTEYFDGLLDEVRLAVGP